MQRFDDLGDDAVVMVRGVIRIDSEWVLPHPALIRDFGVESQGDVNVAVVVDAAVQRGWSGIGWNHDVGVWQRVIALHIESVLRHSLNREHRETVEMDSLSRIGTVRFEEEREGVFTGRVDFGHVPDQLAPITIDRRESHCCVIVVFSRPGGGFDSNLISSPHLSPGIGDELHREVIESAEADSAEIVRIDRGQSRVESSVS